MAGITRQRTEGITFVLLGVLGSGKSSTGNSIIGYKHFMDGVGTVAVTTACQSVSKDRFGVTLTIIDTPGLDIAVSIGDPILAIKTELDKRTVQSQENKVVYVLTIRIGRYTSKEKLVLHDLFNNYKQLLKNCIIIFTYRKELSEEDNSVDWLLNGWIEKNPSLQKLIIDNKLEYLAFENKHVSKEENDNQVKKLLLVANGLEGDEPTCPVSEKTIIVDKKCLKENFGKFGEIFFDEQETLQKQLKYT